MTVATLTEVLKLAQVQNFAVAGLVVLGWEDAKAFVEAGEALGRPIILQAGPGCRQHTPVPILGKMFRHLAEQSTTPVVCHIDHAYAIDECKAGIDYGFTSVMIDGSKLELQANIDLTAAIVDMAHRAGVSVEGEAGFVGYANGAQSNATTPEEAALFECGSGADAIAISIGNVHLQQSEGAGIDRHRLLEIEAVTTKPLVLHGGSGIAHSLRSDLARNTRIKKFNIGTELRMAFGASLRQSLADQPQVFDRNALLTPTIAALRDAAKIAIQSLT
jgi:fructose-bisphosphate aldolase, class II